MSRKGVGIVVTVIILAAFAVASWILSLYGFLDPGNAITLVVALPSIIVLMWEHIFAAPSLKIKSATEDKWARLGTRGQLAEIPEHPEDPKAPTLYLRVQIQNVGFMRAESVQGKIRVYDHEGKPILEPDLLCWAVFHGYEADKDAWDPIIINPGDFEFLIIAMTQTSERKGIADRVVFVTRRHLLGDMTSFRSGVYYIKINIISENARSASRLFKLTKHAEWESITLEPIRTLPFSE